MPGLFETVGLGAAPRLERDASEALLREMGDRLCHEHRERLAWWIEPELGLAIGRCASRGCEAEPWPEAGSRTRWLFDGVLHDDRGSAAASPDQRLLQARGFFFCITAESAPRRVVLAVDRHASHPLAFVVHDDRLYFAPEAKALLAVPALPRRLNPVSLGLFFGGGYALADQTLLAGIERLSGGEMLVIDRDGWRRRRYWQYRLRDEGDGTHVAELERELGERVEAAVARNFARLERSCVLLSGGADSRAIAASAHALLGAASARLHTVSWTFGEAPPDSDELAMQAPAGGGGGPGWRTRGLGLVRAALARVPALERRLRSEYRRRVLRPEDFFLRFLTVKAFLDLFLAGDGGRRAYETRLERALALDSDRAERRP